MSSNDASLPVSDLSTILNIVAVERLIQQWLMEDIPSFDFGAAAVGDMREEAWIICKADGILAGVPFVNAVFKELGCTIEWEYREGCLLVPPVKVAKVNGPAYRLLQGERLALNIITRASGIAKQARKAKDLAQAESWHGKVVGTRKVTPGFRLVEKYALLVGGIGQHRNDLSSMVMLKDNHIWSAGDISKVGNPSSGLHPAVSLLCVTCNIYPLSRQSRWREKFVVSHRRLKWNAGRTMKRARQPMLELRL